MLRWVIRENSPIANMAAVCTLSQGETPALDPPAARTPTLAHMDTNHHTDQLPTTIRAFIAAHEARDADAALPLLAPEAVITDIGESFSGDQALRHFISEAGAEFTYTDEITKVDRDGD